MRPSSGARVGGSGRFKRMWSKMIFNGQGATSSVSVTASRLSAARVTLSFIAESPPQMTVRSVAVPAFEGLMRSVLDIAVSPEDHAGVTEQHVEVRKGLRAHPGDGAERALGEQCRRRVPAHGAGGRECANRRVPGQAGAA